MKISLWVLWYFESYQSLLQKDRGNCSEPFIQDKLLLLQHLINFLFSKKPEGVMIPTHLKVGATLPKLRNYLSSRHREPSPPPSERSNLTIDNLPPISKLRSTLVDHPQTYLLLLLDFHLLIWWSELICWIYDDQRTNQHSKFPQHRPFQKSHNINFQILSTPT